MSTKKTKPTSNKTVKKKEKSSTTPTTVLDKILVAIRRQPHTSEKGVSRTAIAKYLQTQYKYDNPNALKRALQNGVTNQTLIQTGHSFRVAGDPVVSIPTAQVTIEDLVVGNSSEAKKGDTVTVKYEGKLDDSTVFDAANSFTFTLGAGDVIKGWDQGIVGMKVGSKRKLFVPSSLGYGKRGSAPDIPPNADLHFVVTLQKIK
ncbi:FK506-binding protein 2 [Fistulifera solaris]|uniref:peptidylprolyl isomerase n=1 Tax=Fistulifera solaris TaxID=1519565 RepID=A0A1Z5KBC2_FISSO|nr:FK506-binding protein 2 [Fistulifera solaris]|eukprot:GAX23381.1 FK506-binding protein 2 [Fistulifera solaris]